MPLVADTGPLNYLVLIDAIDILPPLFQEVFIPSRVHAELSHAEAPPRVREWAYAPPAWLHVLPTAESADPALAPLNAGERAVLLLATRLGADLVLMDDRAGVQVARSKGFAVTGTLGLLELAARRGLVHLPDVFARLRATNFRYPRPLMDALLAQHGAGGHA